MTTLSFKMCSYKQKNPKKKTILKTKALILCADEFLK